MRKIKFLLICFFMLVLQLATQAQDEGKTEMADTMRSNGRIYVVVAVMLFILIGLFVYLIRLDRKINKLEKETK